MKTNKEIIEEQIAIGSFRADQHEENEMVINSIKAIKISNGVLSFQKQEFKKVIIGKKVKWIEAELPKEEKERIARVIDAVLDNILKVIDKL